MVANTRAKKDTVVTLNAKQSREAFEREVRHRLNKDPETFLEEWRCEKLDLDDPNVKWILSLLPTIGLSGRDA